MLTRLCHVYKIIAMKLDTTQRVQITRDTPYPLSPTQLTDYPLDVVTRVTS